MPGMMPRLPSLLLALLIAAIAGSFLFFGYHVYPVPSGDSHAFLPAAISLDAGHGLRNPVAQLSRELDPTGEARFVQYPPLFPMTVALLMPTVGPRGAFLVLAFLSVLDLALAVLLFRRVLDRAGGETKGASGRVLALSAATLGVATLLLGQQTGRPEPLATLWVLLAAHAALAVKPSAAWLPCGFLLGLTGATQPTGGVILGLLLAVFLSVRLPTRGAIVAILELLVLSLTVFFAVLAISPLGIAETLDGIRRHADLTVVHRQSGELLRTYWITNPGGTFYALPYLLLAVGLLLGSRSWRGAVRSPLLCGLCLIPLAAVLWGSTVRAPEHAYNVLLFAPLVFAANLHQAFRTERKAPRMALPAIHALTSLGYVRALVLFGFFLAHGVSLDAARAQLARLVPMARGPVSVTPSLWVLSDDYERLRAVPAGVSAAGLEGDLLIFQQNYTGQSAPSPIEDLRLVEDRFVDRSPRLFGLPVARTVPGYAFAVYRRER